MLRVVAFLLLIATSLAGCEQPSVSGSGVDESLYAQESAPQSQAFTQAETQVESGNRTVLGNGTKGPLIDATVELFAIDVNGFPVGAALTNTLTDANGNWQLDINRPDALLVRISGGRYVDEADTNEGSRRIIELTTDQHLESVLLPGETSVAVTVFTQALIEKSRRETGLNNFLDVMESNRQLFTQAYSFDVLSVLPADPLAPSGSDAEIAYALSVGGVANAINTLSITSNSALPEYRHILDVVEDLVDCRLDGIGTGGQVVVNPALTSYQELSLEQQVIRFRNNNFDAYRGIQPVAVNATPCEQLGGQADTVAPQITSVASSTVFEAQSPQGISLNETQKQALSGQFEASDDRIGELVWSIEIPTRLELGTTALTARVEDAWGNQSSVDWGLTVVDTTPPDLSGQAAVSTAAQGDTTLVILEPPLASDRVTSQEQISLTNDAPAGFPVGQTIVVWTASDEAGNSSTFTQSVSVNSIAPEVMPAPSIIPTDSGDVDFSDFFTDPDGTTLTYSVVGLPEDTGLSIDPVTGILSGTPAASDIAAGSLEVTIVVTDGQNVVTLQTTLNVVAPNTPPAFGVSQFDVTLDEDFAPVTLSIIPSVVPVAEQGQTVNYTIELDSSAASAAPFDVALDADTLSVHITSRPDASGTANFLIVADDGQAEQNQFVQMVSVEVNPVNDPPRLTGVQEPVELVTGQAFSLDLLNRVSDVDDAVLVFSAEQLPAAMSLYQGSALVGMALPVDALSPEITIRLDARDGQGESVDFVVVLNVRDPDSDADGITDYEESLSGSNPLSSDSDDDGFGDSLESVIPVTPATQVIFVGASGNDSQSGDSPDTALATLDEASLRLVALDSLQPALVLLEQGAELAGSLVLSGRQRTVAGAIDFDTLQLMSPDSRLDAATTTLHSPSEKVLVVSNCVDCAVLNVRIDGGQGVHVSDSDIRFDQVQIVATQAAHGGAMQVQRSLVQADSMHFALNQAERGGAISLEDDSQMTIRDSLFVGNKAEFSGGAVALLDSALVATNVLFSANTSPVAAAIDFQSSTVELANATLAYNFLKSDSQSNLFRCRNAAFEPCGPHQAITLVDSVMAGNRNASNQIVDMETPSSLSSGNLVEPGRQGVGSTALASSDPFAVGYASTDPAVTDSGVRGVVESGLENYFSEVDSAFTDAGQVDAGFHYKAPLFSQEQYVMNARFVDNQSLFGLRAIDIEVVNSMGLTGEIRRLSAAVRSENPRAVAISAGTLTEVDSPAVPAISLGDGRYRVWVSNAFQYGQDRLLVRLDDSDTEVVLSTACSLAICGVGNTEAVAPTAGMGVDNEPIVPLQRPFDTRQ